MKLHLKLHFPKRKTAFSISSASSVSAKRETNASPSSGTSSATLNREHSKSNPSAILSHLAGDIKSIPLTKKSIFGERVCTKTVFAMYTLVGAENVELKSRKLRKTAMLSVHFDDLDPNPMKIGVHSLFKKDDAKKIQQAFISKAVANPHQMLFALKANPEAARQLSKQNPDFITQLMDLNNQWLQSKHRTMKATFDHLLSTAVKQDDDIGFVGKHNHFLKKHKLKELAKLSYHEKPELLFSKLSMAFESLEAESVDGTTEQQNTLSYTDLQDGILNSEATPSKPKPYSELLDLHNLDSARNIKKNVNVPELHTELKRLQTINPSLYQALKDLVATFTEQKNTAEKISENSDALSGDANMFAEPPNSLSDSFVIARSRFDGSLDDITIKNEDVAPPIFSDEIIQTTQERILNAPDAQFQRKLTAAHIRQGTSNTAHLALNAPWVTGYAITGSWGGTIAMGDGIKTVLVGDATLNNWKTAAEKIGNLASSSSRGSSAEWSDVTVEEVTNLKTKELDEKYAKQDSAYEWMPYHSEFGIQYRAHNQKVAQFNAKGGSDYIEHDPARATLEKDIHDAYADAYSDAPMSDVTVEDVPVITSGIAERMQTLQAAASRIDNAVFADKTKALKTEPHVVINSGITQRVGELEHAASKLDDVLSLASAVTSTVGNINANDKLKMQRDNLRRFFGEKVSENPIAS